MAGREVDARCACRMRRSSASPALRSTADDRSTPRVFGEYADVYDIRQAVEDGATKPLFYESRIVKLTVDDAGAKAAEAEIEQATAASTGRDRHAGERPRAARSAHRRTGAA